MKREVRIIKVAQGGKEQKTVTQCSQNKKDGCNEK